MSVGWLEWLAVFAIAWVGTWVARRYALARRLIDQPGARRSHVVATPRGGGIAIVAAMLAALAWQAVRAPATLPLTAAIAVGLLLVALVGWIDDHRPLSPWLRLMAHAVAAACLGWGLLISGADLAVGAVSAGGALVLTNVWNFMDGIDGLAASQALLASLGIAMLAGGGVEALLPLALVAACAGFLPFNLPPARIFLGDVGSGALGFLLASMVAWRALHAPADGVLLLLPLSAFLVDSSLTLGRRLLRGEHWWLPHAQHAYQQWTRRCRRHGVVTLAYSAWTAAALVLMQVSSTRGTMVKMPLLAAWYVAGAATWMWLQRSTHSPGDRE